jgi:hypothetical protein
MITVKHSTGSKKPTVKDFESWDKAIEYCLRLRRKWMLWFDIREGERFLAYHSNIPTGYPVGMSYSDDALQEQFLRIVDEMK